jgi:hypothetical protein
VIGRLRRLFGGGDDGALHAEDCVWLDAAARERGLAREALARAGEGRSVLVVARSPGALERLAAALAPQAPRHCTDRFDRDALCAHLRQPGAVAVALPGALPPDAAGPAITPIEMIICGRGERRSEDDEIARCAERLSMDTRVTFHLALDDPLFARFGADIKPILERLGLSADEPIQDAYVTRAIASAQRKAAGG